MASKPNISRKNKIIIVSIATILILGVGVGVWWLMRMIPQEDNPSVPNSTISIPEPTVTDEAGAQARAGDLEGAYASMDKAITDQSSSDTKRELILDKAFIAYNAQDYDSALSFGIEAEKIKEGIIVSQIIAMSAGRLGNAELAIQYWQKAIAQLDLEDPYYSDDKARADNAIEQLQKNGIWQE